MNIIVLSVHEPSEKKSDDLQDTFYEEIEQVFNLLPKYHIETPLGDFNVKLGREDIFRQTIGNYSLHQDSDDTGVRIINLATLENLVC